MYEYMTDLTLLMDKLTHNYSRQNRFFSLKNGKRMYRCASEEKNNYVNNLKYIVARQELPEVSALKKN
jgi:hypothetical protein